MLKSHALTGMAVATLMTSYSSLAGASDYGRVQVRAWPGASCTIESVGNSSDQPLITIADDLGIVEFGAVSANAHSAVRTLALSCVDPTGRSEKYNVDLTAASTFKPLPAPAVSAASLRPGLSGDPMSYSREELVARGYGLRPDPQAHPDKYAKWLEGAKAQVRLIKSIDRPVPAHGSGTIVNYPPPAWSGGMFDHALGGVYFEEAYNEWKVPTGTPTTSCSAAYIWTGLGGWGAADLIQIGVQMIGNSTAVTENVTKEYWSGNGVGGSCYSSECAVGMNVSPGDTIRTEVWACDSASNLNYAGGYGCFWIYNMTKATVAQSILKQINTFQGLTAEFIAEDNAPNNACGSNGTYTKFSSVVNAHMDAYEKNNFHLHTWQLDSGYERMLSANTSNQLLGMSVINASSDLISLYWMQGQ